MQLIQRLRGGHGAPPVGGQAPQVPPSPKTKPGAGYLEERRVSVGDGTQRLQTLSGTEKARSGFRAMGKLFVAMVAIPCAVPILVLGGVFALPKVRELNVPRRLGQWLEKRSESAYRSQHKGMLKKLETPLADSVVHDVVIGRAILGKLAFHAKANNRPVTEGEIKAMVVMGENIAELLQQEGGDKLPLKIMVNGKLTPVPCNTYTMRALSWYMMAQAAAQDLERQTKRHHADISDMVTSGSIFMKDPGNRIYNFLRTAPTCTARMSSHVEERVDSTDKHSVVGLVPTSKVSQHGIEDYQDKLPGQGGSMLFERMEGGELFVKFEWVGCPPYFKLEEHQGALHGVCTFFSALDRNILHGASFLQTLNGTHGGPHAVTRQEHLHKGLLKKTVDNGFKKLVDAGIRDGLVDGKAKAIGNCAHKFGLPFVAQAVQDIRDKAIKQIEEIDASGMSDLETAQRRARCQAIVFQCFELSATMGHESARLGVASDHHGIERRGGEAHISITRRGAAHKEFELAMEELRNAQPSERSFESKLDAAFAKLENCQRRGELMPEAGNWVEELEHMRAEHEAVRDASRARGEFIQRATAVMEQIGSGYALGNADVFVRAALRAAEDFARLGKPDLSASQLAMGLYLTLRRVGESGQLTEAQRLQVENARLQLVAAAKAGTSALA